MTDQWWELAACKDMPKSAFFPKRGGDSHQTVEAAKAVCRTCPVQITCANEGKNEDFGVWGGYSTDDRGRRRGGTKTVVKRVHGTINGWRQHERYDERPCQDCRDAKHSHDARLYQDPREQAS